MSLTNSMLVVDGNAVGGDTEDLTAYQTKADNSLQTTAKTVVGGINEINSNLTSKLKLIWEGTFPSTENSTITVDELATGTFFIFLDSDGVAMYGTREYGFGGILKYRGTDPFKYAYRYAITNSNKTLTVNTNNLGCYDEEGVAKTITKIYKIF